MSSSFKNRVVGTIVIVALLVIFLPDLLDGKKEQAKDSFQAIPVSPNLQLNDQDLMFPDEAYEALQQHANQPLADEQAVDIDADELEIVHSNVADADHTVISTEQKSNATQAISSNTESSPMVIDVSAVEKSKTIKKDVYARPAWVIQLGSFQHKKNVEVLINKLKREGYLVFSKPIKTHTGELTKVLIGPDLDKNKLDAMIPDLKKLTNLSGKLAIYQPTE